MWVFTVSLSLMILIYMSHVGFVADWLALMTISKSQVISGVTSGETTIKEADGEVQSINHLSNGWARYIILWASLAENTKPTVTYKFRPVQLSFVVNILLTFSRVECGRLLVST